MMDDTPWINGVVAAQRNGRDVRCCTAPNEGSRETAAKGWQAEYKHKFVQPGSIVHQGSN